MRLLAAQPATDASQPVTGASQPVTPTLAHPRKAQFHHSTICTTKPAKCTAVANRPSCGGTSMHVLQPAGASKSGISQHWQHQHRGALATHGERMHACCHRRPRLARNASTRRQPSAANPPPKSPVFFQCKRWQRPHAACSCTKWKWLRVITSHARGPSHERDALDLLDTRTHAATQHRTAAPAVLQRSRHQPAWLHCQVFQCRHRATLLQLRQQRVHASSRIDRALLVPLLAADTLPLRHCARGGCLWCCSNGSAEQRSVVST